MGDGVKGIVMGYDASSVFVLILGDQDRLRMGMEVHGASEPFQVPVGDAFLGRMVTALADPCDQAGRVEATGYRPVFNDSPPITHRAAVSQLMPTGTKIVDMLSPIAKGQRQLILGDRMTGKTVIALDAMLNQKGRDVVCIYCAIGKSMAGLQKVVTTLHDYGALPYSVIVAATDNTPVGEQYIAPFTAATLGEYFVSKGRDVLVVLDDMTKHAWAYRQLSLLLDRPPGREAYPGDIFYVQVQLMERAGKFNEKCGGGSMTFLAVAETMQGDMTGYIPSNLVSMCDGQVCMSSTIFAQGFRPAVDPGLSLSNIGGRVQPPIVKALGRSLRADYARYTEMLRLSRLSSSLSSEAERVIRKGEALLSILQQGQNRPVPTVAQVLLLYALEKGGLTELAPKDKERFREEIFSFATERAPDLLRKIAETMDLTSDIDSGLRRMMESYLAAAGTATGGGGEAQSASPPAAAQ
jgi:F-type H+/Na+-transporting ATPase subunit alpha